MNEADTRAELIDKQLEAAGWKTGNDVRVFREFNINDGEIRSSGIKWLLKTLLGQESSRPIELSWSTASRFGTFSPYRFRVQQRTPKLASVALQICQLRMMSEEDKLFN